jgi:NAD(P)H-dependent FMN reductase
MIMKVLGVAGSFRRDSHNRKLLRAAGSLLPPEVQFAEYDRLKFIPAFDEDDEPAPPLAVTHWREAIADADAIVFATPEYNSSVPGQLKNAIDWASRPVMTAALRNKPVAMIGASTGSFGAVWAQAELQAMTTLDVLAEGRGMLGIGSGAAFNASEASGLGLPFPPAAERIEPLELMGELVIPVGRAF